MRRIIFSSAGLGLLVMLIALINACTHDGGSASGSFLLEPRNVTLGPDDTSVILRAVGGTLPIVWRVTDPTRGQVTGQGDTATYTSGGTNAGQLGVSTGELGVNTVEAIDSRFFVATATIIKTDDEDIPLSVSPDTVTLSSDGEKVVFAAIGSSGPFRWGVGDDTRGKISIRNSDEAIYTRLMAGNNAVTVIDKRGFAAVASITQPDLPALAISPSSATTTTNGTLVFTAAGGTEAYTWSIATGTGIVSPATGSSTVYTSIDGDTDVVALSDGLTTVFATVGKP
ncbi:MAG: hypothetical protein O2923_00725 [Verrucomicrobia bacterium]|nr:hypothetical protein [Verrucomicrobiota bacterium]MDA1085993.1 hypothetical protein [Verrucomicrobiota bacterium]